VLLAYLFTLLLESDGVDEAAEAAAWLGISQTWSKEEPGWPPHPAAIFLFFPGRTFRYRLI
jgi:hypothetical protein